MADQDERREDGTRHRSALTWLVATAAVVLIVVAGVLALRSNDGDNPPPGAAAPTTLTLHAPVATAGRCLAPTPEALGANADLALDGTVLSLAGDRVTLEVSRWYTSQDFDRVRVTDSPARLRELVGAAELAVGERFLVAGDDRGRVMVCGFTAPWSADLAATYESAFAS